MMTALQELEMLDAILWIASKNAFTALATKHFLNQQFYGLPDEEMRKIFMTNVANNILFAGNLSLIENSIVDFYEQMAWHNANRNPKFESEDLKELRKHRVVISHSANVEFSDKKVQDFYVARKQYRDNVVIRLWQIRKSVIEKIAYLGGKERPPLQIAPQVGTAELICSALNLSLRPESPIYSLQDIHEVTPSYFSKFQAAIERATAEGVPAT